MESDSLFDKGCHFFDSAEFFEAHEAWEDLWNDAQGARHAYLQCLIQVAVAMHHAGNENWAGTRKLLASSLSYLEKGRSAAVEVDLNALKDHVLDFELALQARLAGGPPENQGPLPFFKLPLIKH